MTRRAASSRRDDRQRQPVEAGRRRRERGRPDAEHAVVAAGHGDPLEDDRPHDLGEGERQHGEVDAGQRHGEPADERRADHGEQRPGRQGEQHRQPGPFGRQRRPVGAEPEGGGVAERGEAADAHHQVQAGGEEDEDQDLRGDRQAVVAERQRRQRGDKDEAGEAQAAARRQRLPRARGDAGRGARRRRRLAEQTVGPRHQHRRHDKERKRQRESSAVRGCRRR